MQLFFPLPDIGDSLRCLDTSRLGKQRVETSQILRALYDREYGWQNHPATQMARQSRFFLRRYYNESILQWVERGYQNTMPFLKPVEIDDTPWWFGHSEFHRSHRVNLIRKMPEHYLKLWPNEDCSQPHYLWPQILTNVFKIGTTGEIRNIQPEKKL